MTQLFLSKEEAMVTVKKVANLANLTPREIEALATLHETRVHNGRPVMNCLVCRGYDTDIVLRVATNTKK